MQCQISPIEHREPLSAASSVMAEGIIYADSAPPVLGEVPLAPASRRRRPSLANADALVVGGGLRRMRVASGIARRISKQLQFNWCPQRIKLTLAGCVVGLTCFCPAAADDPSGYIRKSSWYESLLASIEAVSRSGAEDGFAPFESETMRGVGKPV